MDPNVPSTSAAGSESDSVNPTRPYHDDDDRREREWLEEARRELFGMLSAGAHEDVTVSIRNVHEFLAFSVLAVFGNDIVSVNVKKYILVRSF